MMSQADVDDVAATTAARRSRRVLDHDPATAVGGEQAVPASRTSGRVGAWS